MVATSSLVVRFLNVWSATTKNILIIPSFSNFGLCAACWSHFMHHTEPWPTWVSHPFSFLRSSFRLARWKHHHIIITSPILKLVLHDFAFPGPFPYIMCYLIIYPYFILVGLLLQYLALFQSKELIKSQRHWNWCKVAVSMDLSALKGTLTFLCFYFYFFPEASLGQFRPYGNVNACVCLCVWASTLSLSAP